MTQSNDLSQRVDRTEGQMVDLQMTANLVLQAIDKNSTDIAQLIEVSRHTLEMSRRNSENVSALQLAQIKTEATLQVFQQHTSENVSALQLAQIKTEAALQVFQQHTDEAIQDIRASITTLTASNERMEQLLEYVIRRDRGQSEE